MQNKNSLIIIVAVVVVVAGATILAALLGGSGTNPKAAGESAASSTVAAFGKTLQQVSILAPDASSTIASMYAQYVDPVLLRQWEADPRSAPGRVVSSPWPDHIKINSVVSQGVGYIVNGEIVFMTSDNVAHGGVDSTAPVVVQLEPEGGTLMIVAFQEQQRQQ